MKPHLPRVAAFLVFVALLTVYGVSPVRTVGDSRWSMPTAVSLRHGQWGDLTRYMPRLAHDDFYAIEFPRGRPRTIFPIGVSVLILPAIVVREWLDPTFDDDLIVSSYNYFEKFLASIIGALAGAIFFRLLLDEFHSTSIALAGTVIFALGTSMWSTATRALWQHGPVVLMLTIAMLLAARARREPRLISYLGLPLAFAYISRPTAAVAVVTFTIYALTLYRQWFVRYCCWALLLAIPWLAFNYFIYGTWLPPYYAASQLSVASAFLDGLAGIMISPSRGLLIFTPVMLFAISGFLIAMRDPKQRALHMTFGATAAGMVCAVAMFPNWYAGHSYGPRYMTDVLPFLAYYVAFNFDLPSTVTKRLRYAILVVIAACAVVGVAIHGYGALSGAPYTWNVIPDDIDRNRARVWDWNDPQFLRTDRAPRG